MFERQKPGAGALAGTEMPQRLGKNLKGYSGDRIDIEAVLADCVKAARTKGWMVEDMLSAPKRIVGLSRRGADEAERRNRLYLSTGIHGDEPAGPLAVRQLLQEDSWPARADLWLCPCLNPTGFLANRRENAEGIDLNRD